MPVYIRHHPFPHDGDASLRPVKCEDDTSGQVAEEKSGEEEARQSGGWEAARTDGTVEYLTNPRLGFDVLVLWSSRGFGSIVGLQMRQKIIQHVFWNFFPPHVQSWIIDPPVIWCVEERDIRGNDIF